MDQLSKREEGTYFALRIMLILTTLFVLLAVIQVKRTTGRWPFSISDTFHSDAQFVFSLGLACAGVLMIVVLGDTLLEQTLLNIAGILAMVVAGVPVWPKTATGAKQDAYPQDLADRGEMFIWSMIAITVIAVVLGLTPVRHKLFPRHVWPATLVIKIITQGLYVLVILVWLFALLRDDTNGVVELHLTSAFSMFALLAIVMILRTHWAVSRMKGIDPPVKDGLTVLRTEDQLAASVTLYDRWYGGLAIAMMLGLGLSFYLVKSGAQGTPRVTVAEVIPLLIFAAFWVVQTWELRSKLAADD